MARRAASKASVRDFHGMLILAQWTRSFFCGEDFDRIRNLLNREELEGSSENGYSNFYEALMLHDLFNRERLQEETYRQYDRNIIRHWADATRGHEPRIRLKYFQYLTLFATEIYLDWYFNRKQELLAELNRRVAGYNTEHPKDMLPPYTEDDLNKVAFWEATGAGKTHLLHVNILQYRHYAKQAGKLPDRTILLTPNEGLTRQHLDELEKTCLKAQLLQHIDKGQLNLSDRDVVSVVDSGKLISEQGERNKGEKSFIASEFEDNNLVLVDEGHHGSTSSDQGKHRRVRKQLCRDGFSFEYSATFGQAVAGEKNELRHLYAKSILFDYSYRYFYADGYGKNSFILNMNPDDNAEQLFRYMCAGLLAYYQQHYVYAKHPEIMAEHGIEKPLCVFVGNTATSTKKKPTKTSAEATDVETVVRFFADVLARRTDVEQLFDQYIRDENVLMAKDSNPIKGRYKALMNLDGAAIYSDMLRKVFNASRVERLKIRYEKASDEITLSVGDEGEPFALIYIGLPQKFIEIVDENKDGRYYDVHVKDISNEHFAKLKEKDSPISFLIGARKFIEGWSSWRVSSMGLLSIGQNEGTQIIQLFGRGVRLRGKGMSLRRTTPEELKSGSAKDAYIEYLETLHIFGVRADYMAQFRAYLEEEGISTQDQVLIFPFKIRQNELPDKLMAPQVRNGYRLNQKQGFKTQPVELFRMTKENEEKLKSIIAKYDDYSYVQMMTTGNSPSGKKTQADEVKIDRSVFPFINWDKIYLELLEEKGRAGYWNMSIDKERLISFAQGDSWYRLIAKKEDVTFDSIAKLKYIEKILLQLLINYMELFYKRHQALYEDEHREMRAIDPTWMPTEYSIEISADKAKWKEKFNEILEEIWARDIREQEINKMSQSDFIVIAFNRHLYNPLFYTSFVKGQAPFTISPLSLGAESEAKFIQDLQSYYDDEKNAAFFKDKDMYIMRNASNKRHGIGFAQAGNFYPDFMMWLVDKSTQKQYLTFIDPKGLRNEAFDSPKLNFSSKIKELQRKINSASAHADIVLNSVILSATAERDLIDRSHTTEEYEAKNIFFPSEDKKKYISKLLAAALKE